MHIYKTHSVIPITLKVLSNKLVIYHFGTTKHVSNFFQTLFLIVQSNCTTPGTLFQLFTSNARGETL